MTPNLNQPVRGARTPVNHKTKTLRFFWPSPNPMRYHDWVFNDATNLDSACCRIGTSTACPSLKNQDDSGIINVIVKRPTLDCDMGPSQPRSIHCQAPVTPFVCRSLWPAKMSALLHIGPTTPRTDVTVPSSRFFHLLVTRSDFRLCIRLCLCF